MRVRFKMEIVCDCEVEDMDETGARTTPEEGAATARRALAEAATPLDFLRDWNLIDNPTPNTFDDVVESRLVGDVQIIGP